jgi:hypothetical protein
MSEREFEGEKIEEVESVEKHERVSHELQA